MTSANPSPANDRRGRDGASVNPYASPTIPDPVDPMRSTEIGAWCDDDLLVMHRSVTLPMVCVKSGEPATQLVLTRIWWSPPGISFWPRSIELRLPLTDEYAFRVRWIPPTTIVVFAATLIVVPVSSFFLSPSTEWFFGISVGTVFMSWICVVWALAYAKTLAYEKSQANYYWFSGAHPNLLAHLPPWPYG